MNIIKLTSKIFTVLAASVSAVALLALSVWLLLYLFLSIGNWYLGPKVEAENRRRETHDRVEKLAKARQEEQLSLENKEFQESHRLLSAEELQQLLNGASQYRTNSRLQAPHFKDDTIYVRPDLVPSPAPAKPIPSPNPETFYVGK